MNKAVHLDGKYMDGFIRCFARYYERNLSMKKVMSFFILLSIIIQMSAVSVLADNKEVYIHVSMNGSDNNSGVTEEKAVKTIQKASSQVEAFMNVYKGRPITVIIHEGEYNIDSSVNLASGKNDVKVTYKPSGNDKVVFKGSKRLDSNKFHPIEDTEALKRINENVRNKLVCMDISDICSEFAEHAMGYYGAEATDYYELFKNSDMQTIARYPNDGYMSGKADNTNNLIVSDEKAALWKSASEYQKVRLNGYLKYDWAYARTYITDIDTEKNQITFNEIENVTASNGNKFYVFDMLEELDSPGEWYIDRNSKILYYYPEADIDKNDVYEISVLREPMFILNNCENVEIKNIAFKNTCDNAVRANNSENITIDGCTFENIGRNGVFAVQCMTFTVSNSSFYNTGSCGVNLSGGDTDTLTESSNKIINSDFEKNGQLCRAYHGAVRLTGCGMLLANNTMKDTPHQMVLYSGCYIRILYNDIKNACTDAGDMGAIYSGRSLLRRGNEIAYNYIHDTVSKYSDYNLVAGIYLDDGLAAQLVHHNVVTNANVGIYLASGSDNSVHDNIFTDCKSAITLAQSNGREDSYYAIFKEAADYVSEHDIYLKRFPTLNYIDTENTLARGNFIYDNLIVNSGCKLYDASTNSALHFGEGGRNNRRTNNCITEAFDGFCDGESIKINPENEILKTHPGLGTIDTENCGSSKVNDYDDKYTEELKAEIYAVLNNMGQHVTYGDYSYFDCVNEYFAKAEVNNILTDEFKENEIYKRFYEEMCEYERMGYALRDTLNSMIADIPHIDKLSWEDKSLIDEAYRKISSYGDDDYIIGMLDNYNKLEQSRERIQKLEPKFIVYDMSGMLNGDRIYSADKKVLGFAGFPLAFYYYDFISGKYIDWRYSWTEDMTDNILTTEETPFKLRVLKHSENKPNKLYSVFKNSTVNDESDRFTMFDIPDGKYVSIRILANSDQGEKKILGIKVNYSDNTYDIRELPLQYVYNGLNKGGIGGIKSSMTNERLQEGEELSKTGGITHYRIDVNSDKTVTDIEVLNDRFEFDKDNDGNYLTDTDGKVKTQIGVGTSRYSFGHTAAIYAMTLETNMYLQKELINAFEIISSRIIQTGDKPEVNVVMEKKYDTESQFFAALYSSDGRLLEVKSADMININNNICCDIKFEKSVENVNDCEIKYFVWDCVNGMKPLISCN